MEQQKKDWKEMKTDILIVGSGCAGLYCALHLPEEKRVTVITKSDLESSDSFLAQGGMCMLKDADDYESYFEDTMKAGHYENDRQSVDIMIRSSADVVKDLLSYGVEFQREPDGGLAFTREGAHSGKRILFMRILPERRLPAGFWSRRSSRKISHFWNIRRCWISSVRKMPAAGQFSGWRMAEGRQSRQRIRFWQLAVSAVSTGIPQISGI